MFTFSLIHFQLNELTVSLQSDFATTYVRESSPCSQISTYGPSFLPARSSAMLCRHSLTPYLNPSWGYSCSTAYVVTVTVKKRRCQSAPLNCFIVHTISNVYFLIIASLNLFSFYLFWKFDICLMQLDWSLMLK